MTVKFNHRAPLTGSPYNRRFRGSPVNAGFNYILRGITVQQSTNYIFGFSVLEWSGQRFKAGENLIREGNGLGHNYFSFSRLKERIYEKVVLIKRTLYLSG